MSKLIYLPPGGGNDPTPVSVPAIRELDYEIGHVPPRTPFEVPDEVAAHMLGRRGNPNFHRYLEHGEKAKELVKGERRFVAPAAPAIDTASKKSKTINAGPAAEKKEG